MKSQLEEEEAGIRKERYARERYGTTRFTLRTLPSCKKIKTSKTSQLFTITVIRLHLEELLRSRNIAQFWTTVCAPARTMRL